jgi:transposase-like protein
MEEFKLEAVKAHVEGIMSYKVVAEKLGIETVRN